MKYKGTITITDVNKKNPHHLTPGAHKKYQGKMTSGFYVSMEWRGGGTGHYAADIEELMKEVDWVIVSHSREISEFKIIDKRKMKLRFKTIEEVHRAMDLCKRMIRSKMFPEMNEWWKNELEEIKREGNKLSFL